MRRLLIFLPLLLLTGCSEKEEEQAEPQIKRENTIEYSVQSNRLPDNKILLQTTKIIYINNSVSKSEITTDTLLDIGTEKIQILNDDDEVTGDTTVAKEYDIYFTIKSKK
jgi:hypothetical protein